jgi:beta-lactam-binding protein with PASTA domain
LVLFIVATFVSMALVAYSQRPTIPFIEGLELAAAQQEFGDDFKLVRSEEKSCQPKGTILSQSPKPGAETQWVEKISVVVSAGRPKSAQLPDVMDKPRDKAERILTDKGLKVEVETKESSKEDVGKVLEQSPPACEMKKDSKVAITIGEYSPPSAEVNPRGPEEVPLSGDGTPAVNPKDQMAPTITITSPADEAVYTLNQPVKADYSCVATEGSELASCTGTNGTSAVSNGGPIDTSTAGSNSFTVTATDNAGNTNSLTHNYKVGPARPAAEDPDRSAPGHSQYANN